MLDISSSNNYNDNIKTNNDDNSNNSETIINSLFRFSGISPLSK